MFVVCKMQNLNLLGGYNSIAINRKIWKYFY